MLKTTLVTKSNDVTKETYLDLINTMVPAIEAKWPREPKMTKPTIQHDNATPHDKGNEPRWIQAMESLYARTSIKSWIGLPAGQILRF
jgi:hypothetical protein